MMKLLLVIFALGWGLEGVFIAGLWALALAVAGLSAQGMDSQELLSGLSLMLIGLTAWLMMMMVSSANHPASQKTFNILCLTLTGVLVLSFSCESLMSYYYFFESSLLPLMIMVLGWGYQPERLQASLYMFFYTMGASLPLLLSLMVIQSELNSTSFACLFSGEFNGHAFFSVTLILAFLVKFPIFLAHLWLPKAHVEAPVAGSMALAGILLKLGGYGMLLIVVAGGTTGLFNELVFSGGLVGGSLLGVLILRLTDLKVAIAYSSVVHMSMVIAVLLSSDYLGLLGGAWMMVAHGFCSSGMFSMANMMYERSHSRGLTANKGIMSALPGLSMFWFLLVVLNFSGPFTLNLFSEIMMISSLLAVGWGVSVVVGMLCFFAAAYSLNLYASSQQGADVKGGLLKGGFNMRELVISLSHVWPCALSLGVLIV